ncbi:unnamed protein product, partial [Mesorhabditis belari]|uniref:Uncharacterized protein n=1 Tax=Mesorhabditis belari TaxID=2138241 RepID=A0AAF3F2V2_9BILA
MELESKGSTLEKENEGKSSRGSEWVSFESDMNDEGPLGRRHSLVLDDGPDPEIEAIEEDKDAPPQAVTPLPTMIIADPARLNPVFSQQDEYKPKKIITTMPSLEQEPGRYLLKNGKLVATIYPENSHCAWVVPPRYNPYNMPAILAAGGVELPADDFITAMELITNDYRFRLYSTLYGRVIAIWMVFSLAILLAVLFTSPKGGGLPVFIFCLVWCFTLFAGIIGCAIIRKQIRIGLRHCVQSANKILMRYGYLAGIEDRGQISCHKVVIQLLYHDTTDCVKDVERLIRIEASGGAVVGGEGGGGPALHPTSPVNKTVTPREIEEKARNLILKYSQGFIKDTSMGRINFPSRPQHGVSDFSPKHCKKQYCLCQYVEKKHFNRKPQKWYEKMV